MRECQVWWATVDEVTPSLQSVLNPVERQRRERYLRPADGDRFTLGVAISRALAGRVLGVPPADVPLDRTCPDCGKPHGRPQVQAADPPHLSISHSGHRIGVAISTHGPVGLDVETAEVKPELAGHVLSEDERPGPDGLRPYWIRKEAVVKATGDGLKVPMSHLTLGPDGLLAWRDRPDLPGRITLHRLDDEAWLALLDQPDVRVTQHRAQELIRAISASAS